MLLGIIEIHLQKTSLKLHSWLLEYNKPIKWGIRVNVRRSIKTGCIQQDTISRKWPKMTCRNKIVCFEFESNSCYIINTSPKEIIFIKTFDPVGPFWLFFWLVSCDMCLVSIGPLTNRSALMTIECIIMFNYKISHEWYVNLCNWITLNSAFFVQK